MNKLQLIDHWNSEIIWDLIIRIWSLQSYYIFIILKAS
jgi:hypothetical protein